MAYARRSFRGRPRRRRVSLGRYRVRRGYGSRRRPTRRRSFARRIGFRM